MEKGEKLGLLQKFHPIIITRMKFRLKGKLPIA